MEKKWYRWAGFLLVAGAVLVNLKNIFTNFDIDSEYAIAMAWRMVKGDRMIVQMWEPHQTSAFLSAFFIWIYYAITGTTTGIAIYLNAVGLLCKGAVTYCIYRTFRKTLDERIIFFMCLFFFTINPKDILLPEFSNMQIWFSALLFCCLFQYLQDQKRKVWLLLAGVCACLEILSYPTCLLVYPAVVLLLFLYAEKKWRDTAIFTGECVLIGGAYLAWFVVRSGGEKFIACVKEIISGDASHDSVMGSKLMTYAINLGQMLLMIAAAMLIAFVIVKIYEIRYRRRHADGAEMNKKQGYMICLLLVFMVQNFVSAILVKGRYLYLTVYIPILLLAWVARKYCNETEKKIYVMGTVISLCSFTATLILTNLTLFTTMAYLVLGVTVAFIPLGKMWGKRYGYIMAFLFCLVTIFRNGYIIKPMTDYHASIFGLEGIVKSGPAVGLMSNYMGPYIINSSMEEWQQYIKPGDKILIVGGAAVSTIGYLYEDTEISTDSTICTPTYNEKLLRYWEQNPEKYPNVVVVDCWYGRLNVSEDSWIMQWIENEFQPDASVDGKYWRYYFRETSH